MAERVGLELEPESDTEQGAVRVHVQSGCTKGVQIG